MRGPNTFSKGSNDFQIQEDGCASFQIYRIVKLLLGVTVSSIEYREKSSGLLLFGTERKSPELPNDHLAVITRSR